MAEQETAQPTAARFNNIFYLNTVGLKTNIAIGPFKNANSIINKLKTAKKYMNKINLGTFCL